MVGLAKVLVNSAPRSYGSEELAAEGKSICSETIGQESEMADAHEALWQYVQEKAPQKLDRMERHNA
jgi:hypothetical protein